MTDGPHSVARDQHDQPGVNLRATVQVFYGDDTWVRMLPDTFTRATPYASFNLHDFHTTDDGVWRVRSAVSACARTSRAQQAGLHAHSRRTAGAPRDMQSAVQELLPAVTDGGWDTLIAHFLGMDHIGHVHRAHGPEMAAKEAEMNRYILQVSMHPQECVQGGSQGARPPQLQ